MAARTDLVTRLQGLLPLGGDEAKQILNYSATLTPDNATKHLSELLGNSPEAVEFISEFNARQGAEKDAKLAMPSMPDPVSASGSSAPVQSHAGTVPQDSKQSNGSGYPPSSGKADYPRDGKSGFAAPPGLPPAPRQRNHTNQVIQAANMRAHDEQEVQNALQMLQYKYHIYNSDIEPEHETEYYCACDIHQFQLLKLKRQRIQNQWSDAVKYPGEKSYTENITYRGNNMATMWSSNPYTNVTSPFGYYSQGWYGAPSRPVPGFYTMNLHQTIQLNNRLNAEAQRDIDAKEPKHDIWDDLNHAMSKVSIEESKGKLTSFRRSLGIKNSEERAISKTNKAIGKGQGLRGQIIEEEEGRWPEEWRIVVMAYQQHIGMASKVRELRQRSPLQYLHLLRAGYFEPIPVAWANQASNPLKFAIESSTGWRGITPAWRGYEDTAEERLYWVLNHREGGGRLKPDFISEMTMAQERMARAVEPPPEYSTADDTCHVQHMTAGYSKQVMPPPFRPVDRPENPSDDTMILLDISGSMDFDPQRPLYQEYLITGYTHSTQPKNKDVAKAIVRRFTDAMANHDHLNTGYDLVTFSNSAKHLGTVTHKNLDQIWNGIRFGGGTRVMTGWQKVKELHFQKHSESATYHPIWGWQAGPETPILRLLLLLDGEATDMDEFELDLLGSSWAHVTIFLIGVDGCPHHHRHANELDRIGQVNNHVSFVDAQGNFPERFVTHELLKRHLGYDISMQEFTQMEELPAYSEF